MRFMNESHVVWEAVNTLPLDRAWIISKSYGSQKREGFAIGCPDHTVTGDTGFHRRDPGDVCAGYRAVTEGAVKAKTCELVAIGVQLRIVVGVHQRLATGVCRVGECNRLLRALIKTKDGQRVAKPRRDDEYHHKPEDGGDPDATEGEDGNQYLYPCRAAIIRLRLLVQFFFTTRRTRRLLSLAGYPAGLISRLIDATSATGTTSGRCLRSTLD